MEWGLWDHLRAEAGVIVHAPIAFALFIAAGFAVGAVAIGRLNKAAIDSANSARDAAIQSRNHWRDRANASDAALAQGEEALAQSVAPKPKPAKVRSVNQRGGITSGAAKAGKQGFALTPEIVSDLLSKAKAGKPVVIQAVGGERARDMGESVGRAFRAAGFEARTNWIGVLSPPPDKPVSISLLPQRTFVTIAPDA